MRSDFRTQRIVATTAISAGATHPRSRNTVAKGQILASTAMALALTFGAGHGANAQELTWDGGATGIWDSSALSGDWDGSALGNWDQGANATIDITTELTLDNVGTLLDPVEVGDITFEADGIVIEDDPADGGGLTLTGGTATPGASTLTVTTGTTTINAALDGSAGGIDLITAGAGNLTLNGDVTVNTMDVTGTGTVTNTGTLATVDSAADDVNVQAGATLDNQGTINGSVTVDATAAGFSSSGAVNGDLTVAGAGPVVELSGNIDGEIDNAGIITATGDLDVTGQISNQGTLDVGDNAVTAESYTSGAGEVGQLEVDEGGSFSTDEFIAITNISTATVSGTLDAGTSISVIGELTVTGEGESTLVAGDRVQVGGQLIGEGGTVTVDGDVQTVINGEIVLNNDADMEVSGDLILEGTSANSLTLQGNTLTAGSVVVNNDFVAGASTYQLDGTLASESTVAMGLRSSLEVLDGATLSSVDGTSIGDGTLTIAGGGTVEGDLSLGYGALEIGNGAAATLNGDFTATGGDVTLENGADFVVAGNFDATGATVTLGTGGALASGITLDDGVSDDLTLSLGNVESDNHNTLEVGGASGSIVLDGTVNVNSGSLTVRADNVTYGDDFIQGAGTVTLDAAVQSVTFRGTQTVDEFTHDFVSDGTGDGTSELTILGTAPIDAGGHSLGAANGGTVMVETEITDVGSISITENSVLTANADITINSDDGGTGDLSTSGAGSLIIADDTTVTAETINTAGTGGVTVGENASLVGTGNTINNDTTVNIAAGGDVTDAAGDINNDSDPINVVPGTTGIYNLNGVGSTLEATAGTINNLNDGEININSTGTIVTAGTNLSLQDDSSFTVGNGNSVTVTVGGTVEVTGNAFLDNDGIFLADDSDTGTANDATINVSGNGFIDHDGTNFAAGTINLTDNGAMGSNGAATVDTLSLNGSGASLTVEGDTFEVTTSATNTDGTVTINNGGTLSVASGAGAFNNGDALVIDAGGTLDVGTGADGLDTSGTFTLAGTGAATGAVTGDVTVSGGSMTTTDVATVDGAVTNTGGAVDVSGGTLTVTGIYSHDGGTLSDMGGNALSAGDVDIDANVAVTNGTLASSTDITVDSGATVVVAGAPTAGTLDATGTLNVANGDVDNSGTVTANDLVVGSTSTFDNLGAGDTDIAATLDNDNAITVQGTSTFSVAGATTNDGSIDVSSSSATALELGATTNNADGSITITDGSTGTVTIASITGTNAGDLENLGDGEFNINAPITGNTGTITNGDAATDSGNMTITGAVTNSANGTITQAGGGTLTVAGITNDGANATINVDAGQLTTTTFLNDNASALVDVDGGVLSVTGGNFQNTNGTVNIDTGEIDASAGSFVNSAGGDLVMTNGATLTTITLSTTGDVDVGSSTIDGGVAASGGTFDLTGGTVDVTGNFIASGSVDFDVAANATLDVADTGTFSFGSSTLGTAGTGSTIEAGTMLFTTDFTTDGTLEETAEDDTIGANGGTLTITANGQVASSVNIASGATVNNAGVIQENVTVNAGSTFTSTNEVTGTVDNSGTATTLSGTVGTLNNQSGGTITLGGTLDVVGTFDQQDGAGDVTFAGNTMTAGDVDLNEDITVDAGGTLSSDTDVTLVNAIATVASGSTLTATGDLNLDGGSVVTNSGTTTADTLTVASGGVVNNSSIFTVDNAVDNDGQINSTAGTLTTGAIDNAATGDINISGGAHNGTTLNGNLGTYTLSNGANATFSGDLNNNANLIENTGTGTLQATTATGNTGTIQNTSTGNLTFSGAVSNGANGNLIQSGGGTTSAASVENNGTGAVVTVSAGLLDVAGAVTNTTGTINVSAGAELEAASLTNDSGQTVNSTGLLDVDTITNEGTLNAAGTGANGIDGEVINQNNGVLNVTASLATTGDVTNTDGATIVLAGNLAVGGDFIQDDTGGDGGAVTFGGFELSAVNATINTNFTVDDGTLTATGTLSNESGETLTIGTTGVVNTVTGTINGVLDNSGDFNASGDVTIAQVSTNQGTGTLDAGTLTLNGDFTNLGTVGADANVVTVTNNATLTNSGTVNATSLVNSSTIDNTGAINAAVTNGGTFNSNGGSIGGDFANNNTFNINGASTMSGTFTNDGSFLDGGASSLAITGSFVNNSNITLDAGGGFSTTGGTTNGGTITAQGAGGVIGGNVSSSGTIDLSAAGADSLSVGGNLSFSGGTVAFTGADGGGNPVNEAIQVGGAVSGNVALSFSDTVFTGNLTNPSDYVLFNAGSSGGNLTFDNSLIAVNGATAYFAVYDPSSGDAYVLSDVSAGIGAVAGNIGLVQSLIGTIVNRPSSPFVSGLAYEDDDNCGTGAWARATGGSATGTARTNNGVSNLPSTVEADYAGLTLGMDYGCFDVSDSPFDIAGGMILGYNQGSTSQDVFNIDYTSGTPTPTTLLSTTETDFTQTYVGAYLAFAKDAYTADVQLRTEQTSFTFNNPVLVLQADGVTPAAGFFDEDVESQSTTLSASISYSYPLSDSLTLVPTGGFGITKSSTDDVILRDPGDQTTEVGRMVFEDHTTSIGFVGATLARTVIGEAGDSAINQFVTATYYKDFSDPLQATYISGSSALPISTEPLGDFGELSVGLSYIKILDGQVGSAKQLNASARVDGRFSDDVEALSLTAQIRLQF